MLFFNDFSSPSLFKQTLYRMKNIKNQFMGNTFLYGYVLPPQKGTLSFSKQRPDKFHIQSNTTQNALWSAGDARALGYWSLLRALIESLVRTSSKSTDFLLRLAPFSPFKRVSAFWGGIWSLSRRLIKEIVSCGCKTNTSGKQQAPQLQSRSQFNYLRRGISLRRDCLLEIKFSNGIRLIYRK